MRPQATEVSLDLRESGKPIDGEPQTLDTRLYMQLHVFDACTDHTELISASQESELECVLYSDLSNPRGVGFLTMSESPDTLVGEARQFLNSEPFASLTPVPELTMTGRTYATGFEPDLADMLLARPRRNTRSAQWPWAIWYPLRRKSEFGLLSEEETRKILGEHARIGRAYGQAGFAVDVRLACYGLDRNDNDFVIGLIGSELYPLSKVIQDMRKTEQTARYIDSLGPFFIGKTLWQSSL